MRLWLYTVMIMLILSMAHMDYILPLSESEPVTLDPRQASFTNVTYDVGLEGVGGQFLAWGDYNSDGFVDLLVDGARLFRNQGPPSWNFTEVTSQAGISGGSFATWADWNNDGFLDFYCAGVDKLYNNNGPPNWNFTHVTTAQIPQDTFSTGVGWADYDNNAYIDLYKLRGEDWNDGDPIYYPDALYRNNGDGTFTNVTMEAGVSEESDPKYGRGASWADFDDDGDMDLYVTNYRQQFNYLYQNNGDGTFTDVGPPKGVADGPPYGEGGNLDPYNRAGHGVGSIWGDYDNDGDLDLWVTNLNHKDARTSDDSLLYRNLGAPSYNFESVRDESGIPVKPYVFPNEGDELFVGCAWGDFNNDGYLDLYLPQIYDIDYAYSFLYMNDQDGTFTDVTVEAGVRVFDTYAGCWADYDNDGDLDLITSGRDSGGNASPHFVHLFRNDTPQGNWLHLKLWGDGIYSNVAAIGARVKITTKNGDVQIRQVEAGMGPHGMQNSLTLEFGFGTYSDTVDIEIRWPQNKVQFIKGVSLNQRLYVNDESTGDLVILGIWYDNPNPISGEMIWLSSQIKNTGLTKINSAEVKYYLDTVLNATQIPPTMTESDIMPGEERMTFVPWDTASVSGSHTIYVRAEITNPPPATISNIMSKKIFVRAQNELPYAVLHAAPSSVNKGEAVFFNASYSTDDTAITNYLFYYGNGENSGWITQSTVSYTYSIGGDYNASLKVRDEDGGESQNMAQVAIEVKSRPYAVLSATPTVIFKGENITFNGTGSYDEGGWIDNYEFDYGDGITSGWVEEPVVMHTYPSVGKYTVSLWVRDNDAEVCESPSMVLITVTSKPIARLWASTTNIYKDGNITFNGSLSSDDDGTIALYNFDFGDGNSTGWISTSSAMHQYAAAGSFNVSLLVRDNDGFESKNPALVQIDVQAIPYAILYANSSQIWKGGSIAFNASDSFDEQGTIVDYKIDFGDGLSSGWTSSPVITHVYASAGVHNASLTVVDNDGDKSINSASVTVEVKARPQAHLKASKTTLYRGQEVSFDASQSKDEAGSVTAYRFDFGDNSNTSWTESPQISHVYGEIGLYKASVTLRDNHGDESINLAEVAIEVTAKPIAVLEASTQVIHKGEEVIFNASKSYDEDGNVVEFFFDFGDGQFLGWLTEAICTHTYTKAGTYTVTCSVRDDDGDESEDAAQLTVEVRTYPRAVLNANQDTVEAGEEVVLNATSSYDADGFISEYMFDFGDGEVTDWQSQGVIGHIYSEAGIYVASLWVMDNHGDVSTNKATVKITVESPNLRPQAQINSISPSPATRGFDVRFEGSGEDGDGYVISYLWVSNIDGEIGADAIFSTSSLSVGNHVISLYVMDNEGGLSEAAVGSLIVKASNEKPVVLILQPDDKIRAEGILVVSGSAEDPDGTLYEISISIDGAGWEELELDEEWSFQLDTALLADGKHEITVRAFDGEEYSETTFTFFVGEEKKESMDLLPILALVFFVIFAVIIIALMLGRPKKETPSVQMPPGKTRTFQPVDTSKSESPQTRISW